MAAGGLDGNAGDLILARPQANVTGSSSIGETSGPRHHLKAREGQCSMASSHHVQRYVGKLAGCVEARSCCDEDERSRKSATLAIEGELMKTGECEQ